MVSRSKDEKLEDDELKRTEKDRKILSLEREVERLRKAMKEMGYKLLAEVSGNIK